ncbi:MAG: UDP-3-O-(3-hydroxymyristoyl)glucosamine N-acyltransferase [Methylobacter sp.]|nr:MAG: UDP-3-O-(3-hydroxymyristoyl)glucosamine N-acyltransferase [Methylobacter sp.]
MPVTIQELADYCGARIIGGHAVEMIFSAADIMSAQKGQVTQLTNNRYAGYIRQSQASACLVAEGNVLEDSPEGLALLVCADPELSFIKALQLLHPARTLPRAISPHAVFEGEVKLGSDTHIGAFAVIGNGVAIGQGTDVMAGVYLGENVKIGKNCRIYPYAVIYDHVEIADNVVIHSGAVIGADGFGYKFRNGRHEKVPQVGNVVLENHVEVGANTCIDRGALGSTVLGEGSKIDNLVQIGHNNQIGKHVIMCGQTGVSGSCNIEDYVILAGSAGIADHVTIGKGATVMARAGVAGDIPAGTQVFGSPAKDKKTAYKEQVAISKLPELLKRVKELEEEIKRLSERS